MLSYLMLFSYKWQLQHHQNLKKIMNALRHLGEVLQEKWGIAPYPIQILEDPEILAGVQDEGKIRAVTNHLLLG